MIAVGVPEITPVEVSRANPAGREGDTDQVVTVPPDEVGVAGDIARPIVKVSELGL